MERQALNSGLVVSLVQSAPDTFEKELARGLCFHVVLLDFPALKIANNGGKAQWMNIYKLAFKNDKIIYRYIYNYIFIYIYVFV